MSTFVHMELSTSDVEAAKQFYAALFGWQYQDVPMPEGVYTMIAAADGAGIGGMQPNPMPDAPNHWLGYVGVASVDDSAAQVEKLGGRVIVPPTAVPGMGGFAIFADPQGAVFAIWESVTPAASEAPATKKKAAKKKAAKKKPAAKKAAAKKKPAAKKPAAKKPAAKKPAAKKPAAKKPAKKQAAKKQAAKKK